MELHQMSNQVFIRIKELASHPGRPGRLPFSPNSIWRLAREGRFPKSVKLSSGVTAWRLEDIEAWEAERYKTSRDIASRTA